MDQSARWSKFLAVSCIFMCSEIANKRNKVRLADHLPFNTGFCRCIPLIVEAVNQFAPVSEMYPVGGEDKRA